MDFNFKNNTDFLNLLKAKENQILERTTDEIQESEGFKAIRAGLKSMIKNNAFNGARLILFKEDDIIKLRLENLGDFNQLFSSDDFTYHQKLELNGSLNTISKERVELIKDGNKARKEYSEISKNNYVVFLLLKNNLNYFIKGDDESESIFFSLEDLNRFNERKSINEINEVLTEYQISLEKNQNHYKKFFIELSHLKSLHTDLGSTSELKEFIKHNCHLVRNKPENTFRDDLHNFLSFNLRVSQVKEFLLDNKKRLDIYLYDEFGEVYLVEVKWVGISVHQDGKKIATRGFEAKDITPDAINQTLNYLDELDKMKQNIVRAYLVVFDARKENLPDTGDNFDSSKLDAIQQRHYPKFMKIKDLRVINYHPS